MVLLGTETVETATTDTAATTTAAAATTTAAAATTIATSSGIKIAGWIESKYTLQQTLARNGLNKT